MPERLAASVLEMRKPLSLQGRTERHAYDSVPLVLHVPSGCAG
jgi:hypothetical protein